MHGIAQDVCKSVRALGFSPARTHRIVDGVVRDLSNNGPEWVGDRLKGLQAYYAGTGEFPGWVRKKTRRDGLLQPKGWLGAVVGTTTSKGTVLTVIATVRQAIVLDDPTPKQLDKWKSAVCEPPEPGTNFNLKVSESRLRKLEGNLKAKLANLKPFGPDDIHGTRYPIGFNDGTIRRGQGNIHMSDLYEAWQESILSAPVQAWLFQFERSGRQDWGSLNAKQSKVLFNHLAKQAPGYTRKRARRWEKRDPRKLEEMKRYPVGHISFLQERAGKLRTVANPNRFVQWQLTPLGEVLSDWVNQMPGVYNLSQEGGIRWIQETLSNGVSLTSADLSSASDTLAFEQVTRLLKSEKFPCLKNHIEYFEQVSKMPWYVTNPTARRSLGADIVRWKQGQPLGLRPSFPILTLCNASAAAKAAMLSGYTAEEVYKDPPFVIVGDDIVMHSRMAGAYQEVISRMGGLANVDKGCTSSTQAEFCSRLITKNEVWRLKARYLEGNHSQNVVTFQSHVPSYHAPHWVKRSARRAGNYHLVESGLVPEFKGDQPKSLRTKVLLHTVLSRDRGKLIEMEKQLHSMWLAMCETSPHCVPPKPRKGSRRQLAKEAERLMNARPSERVEAFRKWNPQMEDPFCQWEFIYKQGIISFRKFQDCVYAFKEPPVNRLDQALRAYEVNPTSHVGDGPDSVKWIRKSTTELVDKMAEASARKQRVETVVTEFDHKVNHRRPVSNPDNSLSKLNRKIKRFEGGLVEDPDRSAVILPIEGTRHEEVIEVDEHGSVSHDVYLNDHQPSSTPGSPILGGSPPDVAQLLASTEGLDLTGFGTVDVSRRSGTTSMKRKHHQKSDTEFEL